MDDLLRYAIDEALKLGADYAEARYQKDLEEVILLKNGVPEISARSIDEGIGVRVLIDGGLGFASTSELKRSSIRSIVRSAVSIARAATKLLKNRIKLAEGRLAQAKVEVKPRIRFDAVDLDAKIEFLKDIDRGVVEAGTRKGVKAASRFFELKRWDMEKRLLTSDGADVYLKIPRVMFEYFITLSSPGAGSIQRFEHLGESRGWEAVESWRLVEKIPEEVSSISRVLLEGVSPPKDPVDLILGPELVGIICHESAGHLYSTLDSFSHRRPP